jgi:hypothetical protein
MAGSGVWDLQRMSWGFTGYWNQKREVDYQRCRWIVSKGHWGWRAYGGEGCVCVCVWQWKQSIRRYIQPVHKGRAWEDERWGRKSKQGRQGEESALWCELPCETHTSRWSTFNESPEHLEGERLWSKLWISKAATLSQMKVHSDLGLFSGFFFGWGLEF